jgi:hypothetical protein
MMNLADVRHLDGIMNTFSLTEKYYFGHVTQEPSGELDQAIYSNTKKYIEFQHYLFEACGKRQFLPNREYEKLRKKPSVK